MEAASRLRSWRAREGARASGLTRSEQSHFERKWKREKKRQDSLRGEESERERERERERELEAWSLGAVLLAPLTAAATAAVQGRFINTTGEEKAVGTEEHRSKENMEWEMEKG